MYHRAVSIAGNEGAVLGVDLIRIDWHKKHDAFNLIVLPFVSGTNILYLTSGKDSMLWLQFYLFALYLLFDTLWVTVRPQSVASPATIIFHHLICLIGWIVPHYSDPSLSMWTSLGLAVEINTFFLIARRYFGRTLPLQVAFYSTWIILRLLLYPVVLYFFVFKYIEYSMKENQGNFLNTGLFVLSTMIFLNMLNLKWSCDLFLKSQSLIKKDHRGL